MPDPSTAIAVAPIVDFAQSTVNLVLPVIVGAAATFAAATFKRWTGIAINQMALDKIREAASTEAGLLVAQAASNLRGEIITVKNPGVVAAANKIIEALPGAAARAGVTPEIVAKFVAGEVGKIQPAPATPAVAS